MGPISKNLQVFLGTQLSSVAFIRKPLTFVLDCPRDILLLPDVTWIIENESECCETNYLSDSKSNLANQQIAWWHNSYYAL